VAQKIAQSICFLACGTSAINNRFGDVALNMTADLLVGAITEEVQRLIFFMVRDQRGYGYVRRVFCSAIVRCR
jgi:hypothetical protein